MKQVLLSTVVAAAVAAAVTLVFHAGDESGGGRLGVPGLSYTMELVEDGWVDAARGAGIDRKPLADASHSICYLTKIEIKGIRAPEDSNSCAIGIDEFTGYWELTAAVEEGGQSEVRCNARCLVWEGSDAQ